MVLFFFFFFTDYPGDDSDGRLEKLVKADRDGDKPLELSKSSRLFWIEQLHRLLVNRNVLASHIQLLRFLQGGEFQYTDLLTDRDLNTLLESGLGELDDATLGRLTLSPFALYAVLDEVVEESPAYWEPFLTQVGKEALGDEVLPEPRMPELPG